MMRVMTKHSLEDMLAASPSRMVVMAYDEAIGALRTSVMAIHAGDIECRCNSVTMYNDAEIAEEVIGLLEPLRDSWIELDARIADGTADLSIDPALIARGASASPRNGAWGN